MKFISEFKEFALKGNMIDIAIGVVLGTAFNKVVDVLVKDILLPPLLLLTDGMHWEAKRLVLREAVQVNGVLPRWTRLRWAMADCSRSWPTFLLFR